MAAQTMVGSAAARTEPAPDDAGRNESRQEREDRNLIELLQELRVAGLGVQVLFGFLLSLPFTNHFDRLDSDQRHLYMATLLLAALSTALLTAPVAVHRLVFRQHRKEHLVRAANAMALAGLATVGFSITGAVWLVSSVVTPGVTSALVAGTAAIFTLLWLVIPILGRLGWTPETAGRKRP
jgi:hypothetical protein